MVTRRSQLAADILGGKYGPEDTPEHEAKKELHQLCDLEEGLSSWEETFVDSVMNQVKAGRTLSDKQIETLHRVFDQRIVRRQSAR